MDNNWGELKLVIRNKTTLIEDIKSMRKEMLDRVLKDFHQAFQDLEHYLTSVGAVNPDVVAEIREFKNSINYRVTRTLNTEISKQKDGYMKKFFNQDLNKNSLPKNINLLTPVLLDCIKDLDEFSKNDISHIMRLLEVLEINLIHISEFDYNSLLKVYELNINTERPKTQNLIAIQDILRNISILLACINDVKLNSSYIYRNITDTKLRLDELFKKLDFLYSLIDELAKCITQNNYDEIETLLPLIEDTIEILFDPTYHSNPEEVTLDTELVWIFNVQSFNIFIGERMKDILEDFAYLFGQ